MHVVTSCQDGPMDSEAATAFTKLGFAKVYWIKGGTQAWLGTGLPSVW